MSKSSKACLEATFSLDTVFHPNNQSFVIGQLGQSLDGRIALENGQSRFINGRPGLTHLHRLRARVDGIIIGIATALQDDPKLTVRHCDDETAPPHLPARIVIDPHHKLNQSTSSATCFCQDGARCFVITRTHNARLATLNPHVTQILLPYGQNGFAPKDMCVALAKHGVAKILVEGGAKTLSAFLHAGYLNRLHILQAPIILGSGKTGLNFAAITDLNKALRPKVTSYDLGEGEILIDCDFGGKGGI